MSEVKWPFGPTGRSGRSGCDEARVDRSVREQAAWALGVIGDGRAVEPLLPLLKDQEPAVRRQAAWAIGVLSK